MTTLLVDGHHMLHRCAFIPELQRLSRSTGGVPTGPVFGFLRVLRGNLNTFKATSCVVVWDVAGSTSYRKEIYPEYKANREQKDKPEALAHISEQKDILQEILPYLNVKQMGITGYEGDDLIQLFIRTIFKETDPGDQPKLDIVVVSGDRDLLQLVTDGVEVYRPIADELVNSTNFEEVTGTPSSRYFILRKAIVGDVSDNILGIKGVGEKTADKLLKEAYYDEDTGWDACPDLDKLKGLCEGHKSKTGKRVAEQWDIVVRNLKLVDLFDVKFGKKNYDKAKVIISSSPGNLTTDIELIKVLGKYEFNEFTGRFGQWITPFRRLS